MFGFAFGAFDDVGIAIALVVDQFCVVGGEAEFASTLAIDGVGLLLSVLS